MFLPVLSAGVLRGGIGYPVLARARRAGRRSVQASTINCNCDYTCKTGDSGTASGTGMDPTSCLQNCCMNAQVPCRNIPNTVVSCNSV